MINHLIGFAGDVAYLAGLALVVVAVFIGVRGVSRNDLIGAGVKALLFAGVGLWLMQLHATRPF